MLFRLSSGRVLEFVTYGVPLATSRATNPNVRINILYHHGWPSCRHEAAFLHPHAVDLGLRVLAVNRPGFGRSSFEPASYSFQSIADDVRQLLDALGLDKVVFMGTSGGGPYACACASLLPERTSAVCLVASMTHTRDAPGLLQGMALSNRLGYLAINHLPGVVSAALGAGTALLRLGAMLGLGPMATTVGTEAERSRWGSGAGGSDDTVFVGGAHDAGVVLPAQHHSAGGAAAPGKGSGVALSMQEESVGRSVSDVGTCPATTMAAAGLGGPGDSSNGGGKGGSSLRRAAAGSLVSGAATSLMLLAGGFSAADRAAVARQLRQRPELVALMTRSGMEAAAQGLGPLWADMRLTSEPWHLPCHKITATTFIWQGDHDLNVTVPMAKYLHATIPGARGKLRIVEGAGHISLGLDHGREVMEELVRQLTPPGGDSAACERGES